MTGLDPGQGLFLKSFITTVRAFDTYHPKNGSWMPVFVVTH